MSFRQLMVPAAFAGLFAFGGCGSTMVVRVTPLPPAGRPLEAVFVPTGAPADAKTGRPLRGAALTRRLIEWAGEDSSRLAQAAALVFRQAASPPIAGSNEAAGYALQASDLAWRSLETSGWPAAKWPKECAGALDTYNKALGSFITACSPSIAAGGRMAVVAPDGTFEVKVRYPDRRHVSAGYFDRMLCVDRLEVQGVRERVRVGVFGAALIGERWRTSDRMAEMALQPPLAGITMPLTGVLRFGANRDATLEILDPAETDTVSIGGSRIKIAADFSAPLAFAFSGINDLRLGIRGLVNVGRFKEKAGIYLTEPFDPDRIPVLMIHGLSSSPLIWRDVAAQSLRDPAIRKRFQFWYAYYPSGAPLLQSALWIREAIARIRGDYDPSGRSVASQNLVLVGHSMGGLISQILSTNIGDRLWAELSNKPFETLPLDESDKAAIRSRAFWTVVPGVRAVVFIATPHRGAGMADMSFARIGNYLIRLPGEALGIQRRMLGAIGDAVRGDVRLPRAVSGVNSLSPQSPLYRALEHAPFGPGIRIYSVIGDRGRGDSPESSDGVVPYWSSHLDGVEEEIIVPTGHNAQTHTETEALIRRVLLTVEKEQAYSPSCK